MKLMKLDRATAETFVNSGEFAFTWEIAKQLAPLTPELARQEIADNWDYLTQRCDVKSLIETVAHIRASAINRYIDQDKITRAVERHLESL